MRRDLRMVRIWLAAVAAVGCASSTTDPASETKDVGGAVSDGSDVGALEDVAVPDAGGATDTALPDAVAIDTPAPDGGGATDTDAPGDGDVTDSTDVDSSDSWAETDADSDAAAPGCPFVDCDPAWALLGPVCVEDPVGFFTQFPNPYAACCSPGHYVFLVDIRVKRGFCPLPEDPNDPAVCGKDCPSYVSPVCGKDPEDGVLKTYLNSCVVQTCGVDLECNAPCPDATACPQCAAESQCAPICGVDGKTYRNTCYGSCLGATTAQYVGPCCDCPPAAPDTLFCSVEGTTHANLCWLTCKGETPAYQGPCVEGCVLSFEDPLDGTCAFYQGQFTKFPNATCATLAGATCVYDGPCAPGTNPCATTNPESAPVCAQPPGSAPITYTNACNAGCAGAEILSSGECP